MTDSAAGNSPPPSAPSARLPPELEARLAAFERAPPPADFDKASWCWMLLLGVVIPLLLLAAGWWA